MKAINELLNKLEKQETKVDSDFFTYEAKKQLKQWYGCFRTYDFESGVCQCCYLKDECKSITKECLEKEENKACSSCFGTFDEMSVICKRCVKRLECKQETENDGLGCDD